MLGIVFTLFGLEKGEKRNGLLFYVFHGLVFLGCNKERERGGKKRGKGHDELRFF